MTEAIFFEKKTLKTKSFIINFILIYGFFFFDMTPFLSANSFLNKIDFILSIIFGVPLVFQFVNIFQDTYIKISASEISEAITYNQHSVLKPQILGYRFIKLLFTYYLVIDLQNPQEYINTLSLWKRLLCKYNFKQIQSPIKIPLNRLNVSMPTLYEELKRIQGL